MFTRQELKFLKEQNFCETDVYDGRFESKTERQMSAKTAGKVLVLTDVICRAGGHRIRTRSGHCAQCSPINIAFTARETSFGNVYVAGSLTGRVLKIGTAKDVEQRERQLRAERYGGFSDWRILISVQVSEAGKVEREISSLLMKSKARGTYIKDGKSQDAIEIVTCSFSSAFGALTSVVGKIERSSFWLKQNVDYEFK